MGRRIEFIETLGKGGFGAVYLADVHGRDDFVQRLAVKVLSADMNLDGDIAARQRDEARLLARLNHDHIVRVMDLTEVDGRPAVLMEYVEGADASLLLRAGPFPPKAAIQVGMAAASALDAAFSTRGRSGQPLRVIHRDIKPANLLISRHGGVKVLDFGVARADFDREGKTGSVQFGTARFMAPEQWLYGKASHKVDVFALGVSLVEILTGLHLERAPLAPAAFADHMASVRMAVRQPTWPADFGDGVDHLLARMLAFEPDDRPTAEEAFEELAELADIAPGASLRRWAPKAVPPRIEARRQKWALDAPPGPSLLAGNTPAVAQVGGASSGVATAPAAPSDLPQPASGDTAPMGDTLLTSLPTPAPHQPPTRVAGVAGVAAGSLVVVLGMALVVPRFLQGPDDAVVEAVDPLEAVVAPTPEAPVQEQPVDTGPAAAEALVPEAPADEPDVGAAEPVPVKATGSSAGGTPAGGTPVKTTRTAPTKPVALPSAGSASGGGAATKASGGEPLGTAEAAEASEAAPSAQPAPEQDPVATVPVSISSSPWGATVVVDGRNRGSTPMRNLQLSVGSHQLTLRHGDREITRTITVGGRNPTSHSWTVETDEWRSSL